MKSLELTKPQYDNPSCSFLIMIACYMALILVLSTTFNGINLWILYKNKLFNPINYLMITLLSFNLIAAIIEAPPMIYKGLNCKLVPNSKAFIE